MRLVRGAALCLVLVAAGCGSAPTSEVVRAAHLRSATGDSERFVAFFGQSSCPNLGVFDAATGDLLGTVRRHVAGQLVAVAPAGGSVYYRNYAPTHSTPNACLATDRREGTETVQRVLVGGGPSVDTGRDTYDEAFSADGRMVAWVTTSPGHPRVVVRNLRTEATRRLVVADDSGAGNPTGVTGLAWSTDGKRLAIGVASTNVITWIHVTDPWAKRQRALSDEVLGCGTACQAPAFDTAGRLWFIRATHAGGDWQIRENADGRSSIRRTLHRPVLAASFDRNGQALISTLHRLLIANTAEVKVLTTKAESFAFWLPTVG
jgi:hypothetical protein